MTESRKSWVKAEYVVAAIFRPVKAAISAGLRLPASAYRLFFATAPTNRSRRDLLRGRVWKLIPPERFPALVTRLPDPARIQDKANAATHRSINGINIEPVAVTDLATRPPVRTIPVHRPPGAVAEAQFMAGCTRCGDCIEACPYDAIRKAPGRLGPVAGTPIIEADTAACMMCEDFPCIASCNPGVLSSAIVPIMGTARIKPHLCLAHHHTTCTVCVERCPVDGAIAVADGQPTVDENLCTGCGVCRYVCPAPENAILLMPAFVRPGLPTI